HGRDRRAAVPEVELPVRALDGRVWLRRQPDLPDQLVRPRDAVVGVSAAMGGHCAAIRFHAQPRTGRGGPDRGLAADSGNGSGGRLTASLVSISVGWVERAGALAKAREAHRADTSLPGGPRDAPAAPPHRSTHPTRPLQGRRFPYPILHALSSRSHRRPQAFRPGAGTSWSIAHGG